MFAAITAFLSACSFSRRTCMSSAGLSAAAAVGLSAAGLVCAAAGAVHSASRPNSIVAINFTGFLLFSLVQAGILSFEDRRVGKLQPRGRLHPRVALARELVAVVVQRAHVDGVEFL